MGRDSHTVLLVSLVLLAGAVAVTLPGSATASPAVSGASPAAGSAPAASPPGFDPDGVLLQATVHPDGSATWAVDYRLRLETDNESAAFADIQSDVRASPGRYERRFAQLLGGTVARAENVTGREMALRDISVATSRRQLPQETGVVTYRFTWEGFAGQDGDRLVAGEGLNGLPLDAETTLMLTWSDAYRPATVRPEPDERRAGVAVWHGPTTFAPDEPRLFLAPVTPTPSPGPTATPTAVTGTSGAGGNDASAALGGGSQGGASSGSSASGTPLSGLLPVAGATLLVGAGLVGWLSRRERLPLPGVATGSPSESGQDAAGVAEEGAAGGGAAATDSPPADLLSPAEQVQRGLERNGGRMRQQELAAELDWTAAKTSRVLGDLREEGAVEVFRLGRENVVTLPGEEL
jgi:hypothetical protein